MLICPGLLRPSREIGVFPTLLEGRDYFYAHPLKIFRTIEVGSCLLLNVADF